eukprot:9482750-Pyramimonas_sp.AAC.1
MRLASLGVVPPPRPIRHEAIPPDVPFRCTPRACSTRRVSVSQVDFRLAPAMPTHLLSRSPGWTIQTRPK